MLKKIVVWFLSLVFIFCSVIIPDFSSFATVVIPSDDNTHYYFGNNFDFQSWNVTDILTSENYNNYFDSLSGELKTGVINYFASSNGLYTIDRLYNTITSYDYNITDQGKIDIYNTYFTPIVINGQTVEIDDCKKVLGYQLGSNLLFNVLLYSPSDSEICFGTGARNGFFSNEQFYASITVFNMYITTADNLDVYQFSYNTNQQITSSILNSQSFPTDKPSIRFDDLGNIFYSDVTCLFQANPTNTLVGENTSYRYDNMRDYGLAYLNNSDSTGFVVDRRTDNYLDQTSTNTSIDSNLGVVDASFSTLFGGKSFEDQILLVAYQLNQYTSNIKNEVDLKLNYRFYCSGQYDNNPFLFDGNYYDSNGYYDSYKINNTSITAIDCKKVYDNIYGSDLIGTDYGLGIIWQIANHVSNGKNMYSVNQFVGSLMSIGGFSLTKRNQDFSTSGEGKNFWNNIESAFSDSFNFVDEYVYKTGLYESTIQFNYDNSKGAVFNDAFIEFTMFIEDTTTNKCSNTYVIRYNYLDGSVQETGGFVSGDQTFNGDYTYSNTGVSTNRNSDNGYGSSAYNGGSSASIGDITITTGLNTIPYILVDIPENDWINKTPNLKNMLDDFKTMLAETKEGSILTMLPATYSYLPAPVWNYILYGVGICVMIGIWHAITRR